MTDYDVAVARAQWRAEGVARFRELESMANASLDEAGLSASERREYEIMVMMARTFARVFLVESDEVIRKMFGHFETKTERRFEA